MSPVRSVTHVSGMDQMENWAGRELNPRHRDFQSLALPTELPAHVGNISEEGAIIPIFFKTTSADVSFAPIPTPEVGMVSEVVLRYAR